MGLKYMASSSKATKVPSSDVGECAETCRRCVRAGDWYTSGLKSSETSPALHVDRANEELVYEDGREGGGSDRVSVQMEFESCDSIRA